jgi:hypothetical protein
MSLLKWAGTFLEKVRVAGLSVCEVKKATTKKGTTTTTTATMETERWMVGKEVGRRGGCPGVLVPLKKIWRECLALGGRGASAEKELARMGRRLNSANCREASITGPLDGVESTG